MPKTNHDEPYFTVNDIEEYAEKKSSFAFELEVYKIVKDTGYECQHNGSYVDAITNKLREYDLRAHYKRSAVEIRLALECKFLEKRKPTLVHRVLRTDNEANIALVPPSKVESGNNWGGLCSIFYKANEFVGKSFEQIYRNNNNKKGEILSTTSNNDEGIYSKWSQAISSLEEMLRNSVYCDEKKYSLVLPVLVIPDGTLWSIDYKMEEGGNIEKSSQGLQYCEYYIGKEEKCQSVADLNICITHLHIVTKGLLPEFLQKLYSYLHTFQKTITENSFQKTLHQA